MRRSKGGSKRALANKEDKGRGKSTEGGNKPGKIQEIAGIGKERREGDKYLK